MYLSSPKGKAFTLVELMVSTAIIAVIMLLLVKMTDQLSFTWRTSAQKIEEFQGARDGFEAMTRRIAQATLNAYWDYLDSTGAVRPTTPGTSAFNNFLPVQYGRTSSLQFLSGPMTSCGNTTGTALEIDRSSGTSGSGTATRPTHGIFFEAPLGVTDLSNVNYNTLPVDRNLMNNALNTWGYYLEAGYDKTTPGFVTNLKSQSGRYIVPPRWRCRLMELRQPTEGMNAYDSASDPSHPNRQWFIAPLSNAYSNAADPSVRVLAENIVSLVFMPKLSRSDEDNLKAAGQPWQLSPWYLYDTTVTANQGVPSPSANINPKNQLPPVVNVTMVALDEMSAKKLADKYGGTLDGLTQSSPYFYLDTAGGRVGVNYQNLFTDQTKTPLEGPLGSPQTMAQADESDLNYLQSILIAEHLNYRIFTTNVTIHAAKWSRVQTK